MRREDVPLRFACDEDPDAMERRDGARHCARCDHAVHDLSAMTEREARAFLADKTDQRRCISYLYDEDGQLHAEGDRIALRGTFLIDRQGIVRYQSVNFFTVMRHVDDILREIDAWQYFEERGEVCPLNYVRS